MLHASQALHPDEVIMYEGFLTGMKYRQLTPTQKNGYAMGFINGALASPLFGATVTETQWIQKCSAGMSNAQVAAILNKYVSDNPGKWHYPMNGLAFLAMQEACK